ncbi:MAG: general secretion pathway protein GspB [Pseudomonadota bacterium]
MSYILEALKKAQAERQLGAAPTIHALPLHADRPRARRSPIWIGFGVGALVMACAALVLWRAHGGAADGPAGAQVAPAAMPATPPANAVAVPAAPAPGVAAPMAQAAAQAVAQTIAQPAAPARVQSSAQPSAPPARPSAQGNALDAPAAPMQRAASAPMAGTEKGATAGATTGAPAGATAGAVAIGAARAPTPPAPAAALVEDNAPSLRELPEAIQREIPALAFGGYIYSRNPADRLLLVDKVLRHEGEEVAPGLLLEKLLPKAAIMNYRGHRYRMPY